MNKLLFSVPSLLLRRQFHISAAFQTHRIGLYRQNWWKKKIGNREQVGYGINGDPNYFDDPAYPFPAIRFRENVGEVQVLRLKEAGDWRKLTMKEKKDLYRASFCHTFAEFKARSSDWMGQVGVVCMLISIGIWYYIFMKLFVYPDMPASFTDLDSRAHQLRRMIDAQVNPITGIASKWDYEKDEWKRDPGWWYRSIDVWNLWYPLPHIEEVVVPEFEECVGYDSDVLIQGEEDEEEKDDCTCSMSVGGGGDTCDVVQEEEAAIPVPETPTTYVLPEEPSTKPKLGSQYTCIGDAKKK